MIKYNQIKIRHSDAPADERAFLKSYVSRKLSINEADMHHFKITRKSIDARKKPEIYYVYAVSFDTEKEVEILKRNKKNKNIISVKKPKLYESRLSRIKTDKTVVVVGAGPAGLFAAYALSLKGFKPILIERGAPIEERVSDVENFWNSGELDEESNVCFGEGGAGTFSDGKINSGIKDEFGRKDFVLETFVRFGAPKSILYDAMPHIGTDVLRKVIVAMRKDMIKRGCRFYFHAKLVGIDVKTIDHNEINQIQKNNDQDLYNNIIENNITENKIQITKLTGVRIIDLKKTDLFDKLKQDGINAKRKIASDEIIIPCDNVILAIGNCARDTFRMLHDVGVDMTNKPFAVGVRVQHPQSEIDASQYGDYYSFEDNNRNNASDDRNVANHKLPAASYKLTGKTYDGRGVYSFCMCPGGYVVNASTEKNRLAVNGMSDAARDSGCANAAIVVQVNPDSEDVFAGVEYQRRLEEKMFRVADGAIPVQRLSSFKKNNNETNSQEKSALHLSKKQPSVKGIWKYADVRSGLDDDIAQGVIDGMIQFGKKIKGFDADDVLIMGLESRTSSPVRIPRDESLQSTSINGLYPCGEGAGYAGGILSAAIDGLKCCEAVAVDI